jgi:hypothetical protein
LRPEANPVKKFWSNFYFTFFTSIEKWIYVFTSLQ